MEDLDFLLRTQTEIGREFNTNILRIALNMQEEQIASIIMAQYCCNLDEDIISHAIKKTKMSFVKNMFLFNKNY